jgi:hypothetical protein
MFDWQEGMQVAVIDKHGEVECIDKIMHCNLRSPVFYVFGNFDSFNKRTGLERCSARRIEPYDPAKHKVSRRNELLKIIKDIRWDTLPVDALEMVVSAKEEGERCDK